MGITEENRERIIALLKNGECFICGKKGFKNIMGHVVRAHGINSTELKDELLLSRNSGFWSEEIKTEYSKRAKEKNYVSYIPRDFKRNKCDEASKKKRSIMCKRNPNYKKVIEVLHSEGAKAKHAETIKNKIANDPDYKNSITHHILEGQKKYLDNLKKEPVILKCGYCGKEFPRKGGPKAKYCSSKCKGAARYYSSKDLIKKTCEHCGKEFEVKKYTNIRFCSKSCSNRATWLKREKAKT